MKKIVLLLLCMPSLAFAHGNKFEMLSLSVSQSLENFSATADSSTKRSFKSVRAKLSGASAVVKILISNQDSIQYSCVMDHGSGEEEAVNCQQM